VGQFRKKEGRSEDAVIASFVTGGGVTRGARASVAS